MFIVKCRKKLGKSETISPDLVAIKAIATYYSQHANINSPMNSFSDN